MLQDLALAGVKWELRGESLDFRVESLYKSKTLQPSKNLNNNQDLESLNSKIRALNSCIPLGPDAAGDMAANAPDIDSLIDAIKNFNHPLKQFAKNTITGHWLMITGRLLVITDSPSADDDESGQIMTGAAGDMLDKILAAIGMGRDDVSILPLVFWRAPGGRAATDDEMNLCRSFIDRAIELLQPCAILTLGTIAKLEIRPEGRRQPIPESEIFSIPHPNYMMLKPDSKKDAWEILKNLQKVLQNS